MYLLAKDMQSTQWRAQLSLVAVGGCLDAVDSSDLAGRAYRSANARGRIERTANVGACETRARSGIWAVTVAVGTTAGRARAGGRALGALDAIWIFAVPALQATGLANWAAKIFLYITRLI